MLGATARLRAAAYLLSAARALFEVKAAVVTVLALFVYGLNTTVDPRLIPQRIADTIERARWVSLPAQLTLVGAFALFALVWTSTQRVWIVQPTQNYYLRSLPLPRWMHWFAAATTLLLADLPFWLVLGDSARRLRAPESATDLLNIGLRLSALALSVPMLQLPVLSGRNALPWLALLLLQTAFNGLADAAGLRLAANVVFIALAVLGIVLNAPGLLGLPAPAARTRRRTARLRIATAIFRSRLYILIHDNALLMGTRVFVCLGLQLASMKFLVAQPRNIVPVVALHLLCFLLLARLVDPLVQARDGFSRYFDSLPRPPLYWARGDVLFIAAGQLVLTSPHLFFAAATGSLSLHAVALLAVLALLPLSFFLLLRVNKVRGMASYNIAAWPLFTWLIAALL